MDTETPAPSDPAITPDDETHIAVFCPIIALLTADINRPICLVAFVLVAFLSQLSVPLEDVLTKMRGIDWPANFLFIASTCSCMIVGLRLTWGGIRYSWASANVLVPLIVGVVGIAISLVYEAKWASHPTIKGVRKFLFNTWG
ncbi:hypothetical protein BDZ89DRAFT_1141579 [Hymenopellis radicata]|nr:hypothetical protein BDZ89DRAFT_1141579 [Hymenopellis radicata]